MAHRCCPQQSQQPLCNTTPNTTPCTLVCRAPLQATQHHTTHTPLVNNTRRQGLLEPPKPKVKLSNLMRVLGEQATLDPTAIEAEVRRQMAERQAAHDDRNLARMLTPAERREKKLRKLFDAGPDGGRSSLVAVYRVADLSSGQHRFKVDVNARENHMSGAQHAARMGGIGGRGSCRYAMYAGYMPPQRRSYHALSLAVCDAAADLPALLCAQASCCCALAAISVLWWLRAAPRP